MKKWSELKQAILDKLFMDESEAVQQEYLSKFQRLANECIISIANSVKPAIREFNCCVITDMNKTYIFGKNFNYDYKLGKVAYNQDDEQKEIEPNDNLVFVDTEKSPNKYVFKRGRLQLVYFPTENIKMPPDFINFTDTVNYRDGVPDPDITYLTDNVISLPEAGEYKIFYNALWKEISKEDITQDNLLEPTDSILNCVPTYVAAQILAQDDLTRSAILKNEYEILLSRLNANVLNEESHYRSTGGWY